LRGNLYPGLSENVFEMSEIAGHDEIPKTKFADAFVNLAQVSCRDLTPQSACA
jgi:hypothetical protein